MIITLWHGGRDLEYNYKQFSGSKKKRWEHGPGLYLTTHYETAHKYSKGNGSTYKVEVEIGNNISDVLLPIADVNHFINQYVIKSKQKIVLEDIYNNMKRINPDNSTQVNAEHFLNLIFNHDAIQTPKTVELNQFLVEHGVDYGSTRFNGRNEMVFIVYNNKLIQSVKKIPAKSVLLDEYELPWTIVKTNTALRV